MKESIITYFIQHPQFFRDLISKFYPLSKDLLVKYQDFWNWQKISDNCKITWRSYIVKAVANKLEWHIFTTNVSAFKDIIILKEFDHFIDWQGDSNTEFDSFASNNGLPWNKEFIEEYKEKINFKKLSANTRVNWSEELVDLYIDLWNFKELAMNEAFPWNIHLFDKYLNISHFFFFDVKNNKQLITNIEFIEKYAAYLEWSFIFANPDLPWTEQGLMKRWEKHIDWFGVARNPYFFQNEPNFFHHNLNHWQKLAHCNQGKALSQNTALPWSVDFIEEYNTFWDWKMLSSNTAIPWSKELIETFSHKLIWGGTTLAPLLNENGEIVSILGGESFESGLVTNESLPWSIDFINHFETDIQLESLAENEGVWIKAFQQYMDEDIINTVMRII